MSECRHGTRWLHDCPKCDEEQPPTIESINADLLEALKEIQLAASAPGGHVRGPWLIDKCDAAIKKSDLT